MKLIVACGGTGGHITPGLAVADIVTANLPGSRVLFIGGCGMERRRVPDAGYAIKTLELAGVSGKSPAAAMRALLLAVRGERQAARILYDFHPDLVVGTGGYACYPTLRAAVRAGIPTAVHESNAVPGLATRMVMKKVDRILVCYDECKEQYPDPSKVSAVGMPVSEEFIYTKREGARKALGIGEDEKLIVSCWGSLGAREMNKKIARFIQLESERDEFRHIHATGSYGWRWMPDLVRELGVDLDAHPGIEMREYIYNMPQLMAAADLVICRAGASTLNEVAASAVPAIIVPSPNVTDNHQEKNARILAKRGAAVVVRESECDGDSLYALSRELLGDPERLSAMRRALQDMAVLDSAERIYAILRDLAAR